MFGPNHSQHQEPFQGIRNGFNLMAFVAQTGAVSVEVFLHRRFGGRYIGLQGAAAVFLIPCFGLLFPHEDIRPLFYFLAAYLLMCSVARVGIARRNRRGDREHSRYNGWPGMLRRSRAHREQFIKEKAEPIFTVLVAFLVLGSSRPLGCYLMFAAFCLMVSNRMMGAHEEQLTADMHDALFEQQQAMARLRKLQGQS
jgi:hypothetical protein